ncbi:hypothetical protein Pmani_016338 [Petrolisthes manimaculis]|uniref:Uncharacterized protein n=1 Tax=Petrolisthes manimaculis TaxID=1843537 RepID=A0AAE1U8V7_9EUCA|nr:hypothetical protein Pmani_016338 [Petrolisthes manimaculis]
MFLKGYKGHQAWREGKSEVTLGSTQSRRKEENIQGKEVKKVRSHLNYECVREVMTGMKGSGREGGSVPAKRGRPLHGRDERSE